MPIRVTITLLSTVILLAMCTPADAGQVASVYTKLDLDKCMLESSNPNEGGSAQWRCKGYNGMCARPGGRLAHFRVLRARKCKTVHDPGGMHAHSLVKMPSMTNPVTTEIFFYRGPRSRTLIVQKQICHRPVKCN